MYKYLLNLKTFDGEGGGDSGAAPQAAAGDWSQSQTEANTSDDTTKADTFEQYMKDHKDEASKWFDKRFARRHADYNKLVESSKASQSIMDMLATKFGIEDSKDLAAISAALEADDYLYAQRADENGRTIDEQREWDRINRENRAYREQQKAIENQERANRQYNAWMQEANNLKAIFPAFDLDTELANPDFIDALQKGLGVQRAFYSIHGEEIAAGAMQQTAQQVRKLTAQEIAAGKSRPRENGLSTHAAAKVTKDLSNLTKADRAELARRSLKGESIRF